VAAALVLVGCAVPDNAATSLANAARTDVAVPAGIARLLKETTPVYRIALPEPGVSTTAQLSADAATARQTALADARSGDWRGAVVHFAAARKDAWCAPALIYNLALALIGKGDTPSAGLYLRAYLTMMPDAPDAAQVRDQIDRIKQQLAREAERYRERADALADALDATPPAGAKMSLRARAYEEIASFDYVLGDTDHGDAMMRKLRALPGMSNFADPRAKTGGSLMDVYRRDLVAVGRGGDPKNLTAWVLAINGEGESASRLARENVDLFSGHNSGLLNALRKARAWEGVAAIEVERARVLKDELKDWNHGAFEEIAGDMAAMFWDGRPDLSVSVARALRAYFNAIEKPGRLREGERGKFWSVLAVLNDLDAINAELHELEEGQHLSYYPANDVSFFLAALAPEHDRARVGNFIEQTARRAYAAAVKRYQEVGVSTPPIEHYFAHALQAAAYLANGDRMFDEPSDPPPSDSLMRFLAEIGDTNGIVRMAPLVGSRTALYQLQRVAIARDDGSVASTAEAYAETACQGWRPRDTAQARAVWTALEIADEYANNPSDDIDFQKDLDAVARDRPEQLPDMTSQYGNLFRMMLALIGN
jgi:hypothetical protein